MTAAAPDAAKRIAIVGAGLVGSGWAIVFARAGHEVALFDAASGAAARAQALIGDRLADLRAAGLLDEEPAVVQARIRVADTLADALDRAAHVQESVLERVDVETAVMSEIDAVIGPDCVVGSSSSGIAASTTQHRSWSPEPIAAVETERRAVLPEPALGERAAWRDRRLMALVRHKRQMDAQA